MVEKPCTRPTSSVTNSFIRSLDPLQQQHEREKILRRDVYLDPAASQAQQLSDMSVPDRGPELLGINIAFVVIAFVAYSLRCFVRIKMTKAFGLDDWLMGMAMLFFILYTISSNIGVHYGTGHHHRDLRIEGVENARHCWWFCYIFYTWSMIFSKLSIGWLLLRISIKRVHSWILYAAMFTSVVAGATFFFVTVFQCNPVSYFWQRRTQSGTCISNNAIVGLGYAYSTFSIISDFIFAIIPGFLVWDLQLKRQAKLALIPLITMGCIASAAVIARLPFVHRFNSPDFLWDTLDIAIWSTVEMGLAITAGSLATTRPLFFLAMHRLGLSTHPSGQPSTSNLPRASKADKLRPDMYQLSASVQTHHSGTDTPVTPHWFKPQPPPKDFKKAKKEGADNESQKSLNDTSSTEEDGMHILVSKSFYVTDEGRSMASRGNSVA